MWFSVVGAAAGATLTYRVAVLSRAIVAWVGACSSKAGPRHDREAAGLAKAVVAA